MANTNKTYIHNSTTNPTTTSSSINTSSTSYTQAEEEAFWLEEERDAYERFMGGDWSMEGVDPCDAEAECVALEAEAAMGAVDLDALTDEYRDADVAEAHGMRWCVGCRAYRHGVERLEWLVTFHSGYWNAMADGYAIGFLLAWPPEHIADDYCPACRAARGVA